MVMGEQIEGELSRTTLDEIRTEIGFPGSALVSK
jgi:hypothetical protein